MYWCNFFKRLGIFLFSLLWLNKALIVFGIFCTLIKYKKANVKKKSKIVCMVIFYKTRIGTRLFGSLITWWFILFIYRQTIMPVHDEGNNFGYIMNFFFSGHNFDETRKRYQDLVYLPNQVRRGVESSVYGDSFSTVTYGWKISRIPYDNLISPIFILRKKINRHTYEE